MIKICRKCERVYLPEKFHCDDCGAILTPETSGKIQVLDNRYAVDRVIKFGSMGCVYKAHDIRLNKVVAIKKLAVPDCARSQKAYFEYRFREEANILSKVNHRGLPRVTDFFIGKDLAGDDAHYLVMTYIDGPDLETYLREQNRAPLPIDEAMDYFRQILEILDYLHSFEPPIIYRDLKPSNVMVKDEQLYLVDFGIARVYEPEKQGTVICTPGYAAPELFKGYAEPRSDLYSLGALVHYLLTGIDPQDKLRPTFVFAPVRELNFAVPEETGKILMSMLEIPVEVRPASALVILEKLGFKKTRGKRKSVPATKRSEKKTGTGRKEARREKYTFEFIFPTGDLPVGVTKISEVKPGTFKDYDELFYAVKQNYTSIVRNFLEMGADLNVVDENNRPPLYFAALNGDWKTAEYLLQKGAQTDIKDCNGWTPLHAAAYNGHERVVEVLLKNNARINIKDKKGMTPLHKAIVQGNKKAASMLIFNGAQLDFESLAQAAPTLYDRVRSDELLVSFLARAGEDILAFQSYPQFFQAVKNNLVDRVLSFLDRGADLNCMNAAGNRPVHIAAATGKIEMLYLLLQEGSGIAQRNNSGETPLHVAAKNGRLQTAAFLLSRNAPLEARDDKDKTPLHTAVWNGRLSMTEFLLLQGADVNAREKDGWTPLRWAKMNNKRISALLCSYGGKE